MDIQPLLDKLDITNSLLFLLLCMLCTFLICRLLRFAYQKFFE